MSNFKVHYAGIRKTQKKSEVPTDFQNPSSNPPQQKSQNANNPPSSNSKPQSPGKEGDSDFLGIYKTNFHSENLDYIDLLLKNKASNGKDVSEGAGKKKARPRAKSNIAEVVNNQPQVHPPSPQVNRKIPEIKTSNIQLFDENDKPASMRPDDDDGIFPITPPVEKKKKEEMEQDEDNFYNGNDTHRNLRGTQTKNEGKLFEQYFNEGVVRRSMSLEDLRVDKKMFNKDHNKSTFHNYGEIGSYSVESVQQDSKQSNMGPSKDDFMANLANYIDYFNKSDNVSYRSMKAGQYFHGNSGKSHRAVQRELEAASHEMRMMKLQMEKMKRKMNELASMNKALTKELKVVSLREEEQQQILMKMQEKTIYLAQKNKKYKAERVQVQELLRQERIENEKNMFSMRQVLANSINIALDQKVAGPYGKEKHSHLKNVLAENLASKKDREKTQKYNFQKDKKRTNGTSEAFASIFETGNHMRSREARMSPKKEGSVMFSQKQASVSSHEEEEGEGDFGDRYSNSNEFENSYGGEEFRSQDMYQDSYLQDLAKDNQIKMIQEKLAELMNSEDMAFNGQGTGHKSTTTKTSRSKQPQQQHSKKSSNLPSYYISKDRQGHTGKQSHLGKYNPQDQYSRAVHGGYGEAPSGNDMTDRSFSLHNSE